MEIHSNVCGAPGRTALLAYSEALLHMYANAMRIRGCLLISAVTQGVSFSTGSIAPYKIIYLLLGGLAIVVGVCVLVWMPDSPVHAHRLTEEEKIAVLERVRNDQGGTENKRLKSEQVKEAVLDIRTWLIVLTTMLSESC